MQQSVFTWGIPEEWINANQSVDYLTRIYSHKLSPVIKLAGDIRNRLEKMFPILEQLCINSCFMCPEPCCLGAKIWFNYQDLLFLHFTNQPIPHTQPITLKKSHCHYLSHKGCTLPRLSRPWICTWYLCPPQMEILRKERQKKEHIELIIQEIKEKRKTMEDEFIRLTS